MKYRQYLKVRRDIFREEFQMIKKALSKVYHFSSNTQSWNAGTNEVFADILDIYLEWKMLEFWFIYIFFLKFDKNINKFWYHLEGRNVVKI